MDEKLVPTRENLDWLAQFVSSPFAWNPRRAQAAVDLANGYTWSQVEDRVGISETQLWRWTRHPEFSAEVDRLSLLAGVAGKAARVRLLKSAINQQISEDGKIDTKKDILDWLKLLRDEMSGLEERALDQLFEQLTGHAGEQDHDV